MSNLSLETESSNQTQTIGNILVSTGKLNADEVMLITQYQLENKVAFGEAAMALNILSQADIDFALAKQFDYSYLDISESNLSEELVAAYKPFSKVGEHLREVRSQLILRWFNQDPMRKVLAIVSPEPNDGKSFIASNLAVMFAQQGHRTLLIDADLRKPRQYEIFRLNKNSGLSGILSNRADYDVIQLVSGVDSLSVLTAGPVAPNPQELLGKKSFKNMINRVVKDFDVVLIDTPHSNEYSDAEIISSQVGAAMIVSRKDKSIISNLASFTSRLQDAGVSVVGTVINEN